MTEKKLREIATPEQFAKLKDGTYVCDCCCRKKVGLKDAVADNLIVGVPNYPSLYDFLCAKCSKDN